MFVKFCRYRVLPAMLERYLAVQEQAGRLYQMYDLEPASHFQCRHDPHTWIEIHRFADGETCRAASDRLNRDPKILALWQAFQATLDPKFPPQIEEFDERVGLASEALSDYGRSNGESAQP